MTYRYHVTEWVKCFNGQTWFTVHQKITSGEECDRARNSITDPSDCHRSIVLLSDKYIDNEFPKIEYRSR